MKVSYDYQELLSELKEEIGDGVLKFDSKIMIVRSKEPVISETEEYLPIIDW